MPEQPCAFHPDRLTLVSCANCGRPICPEDMIPAPVGHQCPICTGRAREGAFGAATYRTRSAVGRRVDRFPLARLLRGAGITQALVAANVAVFIGMLATGRPQAFDVLLRFGALPPELRRGEWWRLLSAMFVHVGIFHLAFNMFALSMFGPAVEGRYGRLRFLGLYLVSGFLGSAASLTLTSGGIRAGASGGVFGVLGAWIAFYVRHRNLRGARDQLRSLAFLVGINLFFGATVGGIDNFAHLGGLVGGFVVGSALEQSARVREGAGRRLAGLAGYAAVVGGGVWALLASGRFVCPGSRAAPPDGYPWPGMLLTREEMSFDFGGARFDLARDRDSLAWIFSQYLYGEVTGVQVGHWLEIAPDFDAAQFLARQANEEMAHVKLFLRILDSLGAEPLPPHRALKFLATDFAGATFSEHCLLEMAVGEGFVLTAIYGFIDTLPEGEIRTLMSGLARQEEGHVSFGEEQTLKAVARNPRLAPHLLGLTLVAMVGVRAIARYAGKRFAGHPVLARMPAFLTHANGITELRLRRLGIIDRPLSSLGAAGRASLMAKATARRYGRTLNPLRAKPAPLTKTYLADPAIRARFEAPRT